MSNFVESDVEFAALEWLGELGYTIIGGPTIAPDGEAAERASYSDIFLVERLRAALARLNGKLPAEARDDALRQVMRTESPSLIANNHRFHQFLVEGIPVNYQGPDGRTIYSHARLVDFTPGSRRNDWLAVNQFTVRKEGTVARPAPAGPGLEDTRRPDIVLFVNGLPLAVIELKNAADERATTYNAYQQLQTYKQEIPSLFVSNEALVAADGLEAKLGTLTGGWEWFKPWKTIDGSRLEEGRSELETLIKGVFDPRRFLDLVRHFTLYEVHKEQVGKKTAGYHQYHAANKAAGETRLAVRPESDHRVGVVWHTQGSGKSLTMLFYAGKIIQDPALQNPTLVVLTDRNDLDDQLFDVFTLGHELLRQRPVQAQSRADLREKLQVASGGVIFSTIQKFAPEDGQATDPLSLRHNIVFIVDEAHRSQYGFEVRYVERAGGLHPVYGMAKYMRDALPNAAFIGFAGTPISLEDRNTRNVFGNYLDIYDIQQSVRDQATVPIYYEARHAKIKLDEKMVPHLDPDFEEVTEGQEQTQKELLKSKWGSLIAVIGDSDRINLIAQDIVNHYSARDQAFAGKAMIVGITREICVKLYDAIARLRPDWVHGDDDQGMLKVVMTGSADDGPEWQPHIRNGRRRKELADRFRDDQSDFKVVIVRDMWLTGFDVPSLHTMYVDKPMQGHTLMQAIARVNRVYPGKDGGLVVSYLPLELQLQEALKDYTEGDRQYAGRLQEDAADIMMEKYEVVKSQFHRFDYAPFFGDSPTSRLTILANATNHILAGREQKRERFLNAVTALGRAYALANPHEKAVAIRHEVAFFQAVKAGVAKITAAAPTKAGKTPQEVDRLVQELVDRAVAPEGIIDLFTIAGLQRPDISILSPEFLLEVEALPQKDVAVELLRRLLEDEINARRRTNLVQSRSFAAILQNTLEKYNSMNLAAVDVITHLIELAAELRAAQQRGQQLGLSEEELAFYDALETNDSAVKVLGDDVLREIAQELVRQVRANVSVDWTLKESAQAHMRVIVKRILRRFGYPPDKEKKATETVVAQAQLLSGGVGGSLDTLAERHIRS